MTNYLSRTHFRSSGNVTVLGSQENKFSLLTKDRRFLMVLYKIICHTGLFFEVN